MDEEQKSLVGKKMGRYELRQVIGEGGMAAVYRAFDTRLERDVAIKLFRRDAFSPAVARRMLKRFDREAKSLARLSHPNIVEVLDYGSFEDSLFLVMKYMPGGTLKEKADNIFPYPEAARLLAPIARALDYAHREGIIHRDVKPANILLTRSGDPMLSDFGIAKIMSDNKSNSLTATNVGVGTPAYMAPEQWVNKVSPRSDIYALGIIFYEMVTGARPYAADTPAGVAIKQATEPIPDPRRFNLELPDQVVHVILKALARRPDDRFENMGLFAIALEKLALDDISLQLPAGEELEAASSQLPLPTIPFLPATADPNKTVSNSQILRMEERGWSGWQTVYLILTLLLSGLVVAAAITSVQGVVTGPVSFFFGFPSGPESAIRAPALLGTPVPSNLPGENPVNRALNPLATTFSSMIAGPTPVPPTATSHTPPKPTPSPSPTRKVTVTPTVPFGSLPSIPTVGQ